MEEKKKGRRGGDRYLFRSEEEDGEEEKGVETSAEIG
jgi:hypothetical protein